MFCISNLISCKFILLNLYYRLFRSNRTVKYFRFYNSFKSFILFMEKKTSQTKLFTFVFITIPE